MNLSLWDNQLSGTIPTEIGSLTNLRYLGLSRNQLTGAIPAEIGNLTNLVELSLWDNQLSGTIPTEIGNLAKLEGLGLSNNELSGTIPTELGSLANLKWLYLGNNKLSGCIPGSLRGVSDSDLDRLGLPFCDVLLSGLSISPRTLTPAFDPDVTSYTAFEGPTAVTVTAANEHGAAIRFLDQDGAEIADGDTTSAGLQIDLGGSIAAIVVEVTSADGLAAHSYSIWVRPPSVCVTGGAVADATNTGLVSDCETLLAARDALAGTATLNWSTGRPIAEWDGVTVGGTPERVTGLRLWSSNLDGTRLHLSENQLTGTIPTELGSLSNLAGLVLSDNQLTGAIPTELGALTNLAVLSLWGNDLTETIPAELGSLSNLRVLWLGDNQLTGTIPTELGSLADLTDLGLSRNQLTGAIPTELGSLAKLRWLHLGNNKLTGAIPHRAGQPLQTGAPVPLRQPAERVHTGQPARRVQQ